MNILKDRSKNTGYLKVILGPMFSGKTTELIKRLRRYREIDKRIYKLVNK